MQGAHQNHARGESHGQSKLTDQQVRAIRKASGSLQEIADKFGVTKMNVWHIRKRLTWKHVT